MTAPPGRTVLVVENESTLADLYASMLENEHAVRTATSGREGLAKADETVDVVLLDRRMPGMSGDELLERLVGRGLGAKVAMLTSAEPEAGVADLPFDDYLIKPVNEAELRGLVDGLLKRAAYDERSQEFARVAAKRATLETAGQEDTERFRELTDRFRELRTEVDATLDEVRTRDAFVDVCPDRTEADIVDIPPLSQPIG